MKISIMRDYSGDPWQAASEARYLERAGLDVAWVAELHSVDAGAESRLPGRSDEHVDGVNWCPGAVGLFRLSVHRDQLQLVERSDGVPRLRLGSTR